MAGYAGGELPDQMGLGLRDAFLRKYDSAGDEQWTRQFGTSAHDAASGVSVDGSGAVYVTGSVDGTLPDQESLGATDGFAMTYDSDGNEVWTRQFGSSSSDYPVSVSADGSGSVHVVGYTLGAFSGQTSEGGADVFVFVVDSDGNDPAVRQFGTDSQDIAFVVDVNDTGGVLVAGRTYGTLPEQMSAGYWDAFLAKLVF